MVIDTSNAGFEDNFGLPDSHDDHLLQRSAALFLLTLKEKYKLPQTAVDFSVGQVQHMVMYALEDMKAAMQQYAVNTNTTLSGLSDIMDTSIDPFKDLHTENKQTKFFKEHFHLVVSPSCMYKIIMC